MNFVQEQLIKKLLEDIKMLSTNPWQNIFSKLLANLDEASCPLGLENLNNDNKCQKI